MVRLLTRLRAARADDRGSLAMAMLLIMVGTTLASLLVPIVVTQANSARFDQRRNHAYDAAQSGIQQVVGDIRSKQLPCTSNGPVTGTVSLGGNERFQAWVFYFPDKYDPRGHDDYLDDPNKQIACSGSTQATVPAYAAIKSQGTDNVDGSFSSGTRTVVTTYVLKTNNVNVPGGLIYADHMNPVLCLDAGSSSPIIGSSVSFQTCSSGSGAQTWAYLPGFQLQLTSTADAASGAMGLCLDAPYTHFTGESITLQPCQLTTPILEQQWIYGSYGNNWHALTTSSARDDTMCWNAQNPNGANDTLVLGICTSTTEWEAPRSFSQDASVGDGPVQSGGNGFLVNYNQFGRCMSVNWLHGSRPGLDPSDTKTGQTDPGPYMSFLQDYTCSPVPAKDPNQPLNQLFNFTSPASGQASVQTTITSTTTVSGNTYCVYSPLTLGGYPDTDKCSSKTTAQKTWTIYGDTGDYSTSYRITDSSGRCLQATDPDAPNPDLWAGWISKLIVTTCSASTLQKWNAPGNLTSSQLTGYHEK